MSKLVKEIAGLCYEVNKLYYDEDDKKIKEEYKERFDKLIIILERVINADFDEDDRTFKKTIKDIKKINGKIKKLKTGLDKTVEIFVLLSDIIENTDTLLTTAKVFK